MKAFVPARFNLPLAWALDFLSPALFKAMHNIETLEISKEDRALLRSLRKDRLLFFTNHPSTAEPPIVYQLGNMMGARFKYMASRQVFDWWGGLVGRVISNMGAFSVIAGIADRESLKAARETLAAKEGKLVLFPEGEPTSGENDSLMPFQAGAAQLSFWALEDARKIDPSADITVLSGFIKYIVTADKETIIKTLTDSISRLEKSCHVDPGNRNLLRRYLHFGKVMLEEAERTYKIPMASEKDFDYRVGRLRHVILDSLAERIQMTNYDRSADAISKLRQIWAVLEMIEIGYPDVRLPRLTPAELEWAQNEIIKAFDFIVIRKDYLLEYPSAERFFEWLSRFEFYASGKTARAKGGEPTPLPRKAHIFLNPPFQLSEYWSEDKRERKLNLEKLLKRLRDDLEEKLKASLALSQPLFTPGDMGGI
ncbi:MAG: 1-acyl-sn-glycerol-3-phosphate acyltransferase [Spirochaetales bacterium]|nr:1-acyl-sn-glycerol-3-phosphate acyltransferase [Spirochaetales bacterium]